MNDKLMNIWQAIEARLRIVVFVLFVVLLGAVFYLQANESADRLPPVQPRPKAVSASFEAAEEVVQAVNRKAPPIENTAYAALIRDSMFSVKSVQESVEREQEANEMFNRARGLFNGGELGQAEELVDEVLRLRPNHLRARQLKARIEEAQAGGQ